MKVYIVEQNTYDGNTRYGVYSDIEKARNKMKELFEHEKNVYSVEGCEEFQVNWINEDSFVMKFKEHVQEEYVISDVEVE